MRSSGRNNDNRGSGGNSGRNNRDANRSTSRNTNRSSSRDNRGAGNNRDDRGQRSGRPPRPEERRYDQGGRGDDRNAPGGRGRGGGQGRAGQGGPGGKGGFGGKGGPGGKGKGGGPGRRRPAPPARSREYEAQIEDRNRERHANKSTASKLPKTFDEPEGERLQKVLARAGLGSRRACEELIDQSRVEVNGRIVTSQGRRVNPDQDEIKVDGLTVASQSHLYFALNKPAGVVSAMEDPEGRQCLGDYVQNRETRLFHVGRLDTETEGLLLLTNHGELAHRLTHPRYGVTKTYLAAIQGPIPRDLGKRLKEGVRLEDGHVRADSFRVVENTGKNYLVEVVLHEGRKHIVRRMLAEVGFPVDRLVRTGFGPIVLGDQKSGWLRRMTNTEVGRLLREVGL
ncbi:23S rRNA pseudouridine2605 synthase [Streptomyces zhaozhouensis]|uniref:Pseudouridine synthase n=1 Tax=Streptomyces zhaozhouensis TaxID=1300267 RepID=A0A286DT26_9ACTN|nr:pseudouridine synthase [Streptomyces zhaozhouensis]SOD61809.1 23S rRNA pseudouridine2605 synthase [Streptomyces zhaozhouensis]